MLTFPVPLSTWRTMFPEFSTAPDPLVQSRLDQAALQIDESVWGNRAGEGQAYLAAHFVALAPGGQHARLVSKEGKTTYSTQFQEMVIQVTAFHMRVV